MNGRRRRARGIKKACVPWRFRLENYLTRYCWSSLGVSPARLSYVGAKRWVCRCPWYGNKEVLTCAENYFTVCDAAGVTVSEGATLGSPFWLGEGRIPSPGIFSESARESERHTGFIERRKSQLKVSLVYCNPISHILYSIARDEAPDYCGKKVTYF